MRDSKPQCCVQQHKLLKMTRNATSRDKHKTKTSKQTFANNLFKILCNHTQGMLCFWKIGFNVFNNGTYEETFVYFDQKIETV